MSREREKNKILPKRLFMKKLPEEYAKSDMPIPADFLASDDAPSLCLYLKPTQEERDIDGKRWKSIEGTAVRIMFVSGTYRCVNYKIYQMLMGHNEFGVSSKGFHIDPRDRTGFWRAMEMIESKKVETVSEIAAPGKIKERGITDTRKIMKDLGAKRDKAKEDGKPIVVQPLAIG